MRMRVRDRDLCSTVDMIWEIGLQMSVCMAGYLGTWYGVDGVDTHEET